MPKGYDALEIRSQEELERRRNLANGRLNPDAAKVAGGIGMGGAGYDMLAEDEPVQQPVGVPKPKPGELLTREQALLNPIKVSDVPYWGD